MGINGLNNNDPKLREEVKAEIEQLGRLEEDQETVLYGIFLKQNEPVPRHTDVWKEEAQSPLYRTALERGYLSTDGYNHGENAKIVRLEATPKGEVYCLTLNDELLARQVEKHWRAQ